MSRLTSLWRAATGEFPAALTVSGDGRFVALAGGDGPVVVLDADTGAVVHRLAGHDGGCFAAQFHPKKALLATSGADGTTRLWRMDRPDEPQDLICAGAWVEHLAWSPDGDLLATAAGVTVQIWKGDKQLSTCKHPKTVLGMTWNRKGKRLYTGCFGGVRMVEPENGRVSRTFTWSGAPINLVLSPDERYLAAGQQDGTLRFWRLPGGQDAQMSGFPWKAKCLSWNSNSRVLAHTGAPMILLWPFDGPGPEGREPGELDAHREPPTAVSFAPSGPGLASGDKGGLVLLWEPGRGREPVDSVRVPGAVEHLVWTTRPELRLYAVGQEGTVLALEA